jgi:hypothetical protein
VARGCFINGSRILDVVESHVPPALPAVSVLAYLVLFSGGICSSSLGYIILSFQVESQLVSCSFRSFIVCEVNRLPGSFLKMVLVVCLRSCHNLSSLLAWSGCPPCFDLAPRLVSDLRLDSVNACHLTRHEADNWESPRFSAFGWLEIGPVSRANPPSAQSQLMPTVGAGNEIESIIQSRGNCPSQRVRGQALGNVQSFFWLVRESFV